VAHVASMTLPLLEQAAFPSGTQVTRVRVQARGLLDGMGLGAPQEQVGRRHIEALAGVVSVPVVQVATSGLLQGVEGVQGAGILGGVKIEPDLVRILSPGVHHNWHIGRHQRLRRVLLPRPGQERGRCLHLLA
jgi:hypothetical protein